MKTMSVLKAKRFGIFSCSSQDTLKAAARTMTGRNISALVVVDDDGYLEGIITRTDLVRACYHRPDWAEALVRDYMNTHVVTVDLNAQLGAVMEILIDNHIHRVVAVQHEQGKLRPVAVLSAADILYHMAKDDLAKE